MMIVLGLDDSDAAQLAACRSLSGLQQLDLRYNHFTQKSFIALRASLGRATPKSFLRVRFDAVIALLERAPASDEELASALMGCLAEPGTLRPSVEAALHGLALTSVRRGTWGTPIPRQ